MRLVYIFHSGFVLETTHFDLLVDYFMDTTDDPSGGFVHKELLHRQKKLYVLSSHFHPDHFNPEVLQWRTEKDDISYIFSRDILRNKRAQPEDAVYLMKGEVYEDDNLSIKAFGSTDVGISFLIQAEGKTVFHAGDLNNWHWKDESTAEEIAIAERDYLKELDLLAKTAPELDVAMFPVDPRLGTDYARGAEQFVDRIRTRLFAPMHFTLNYDQLQGFKQYAESRGSLFFDIKERGQCVEF
ncbi:MBL fold metallo-hydrolase [Parabacteroides sp. PF5-9]|uniref:MBL fold metallo-hydrolase n=1 Tax=Parabacteroides sp. PF5-9 TaxID=1742404 RepID=UPI002476798D|nr:MBL fold metallo-hydrolase [Parabacteroides sp. PF5-9]MDH6356941.1 L-ascorbate metabolism protein UlaG (beta-lactamase superfamily) [Parabacteroides sp. PF5-9]